MVRRFVVAAGTLSLIACATQSKDDSQGSGAANLSNADVPVTVIENQGRMFNARHPDADLTAAVRAGLDLTGFREARVEDIQSDDGSEHLVVQLLGDGTHALAVARLDVDAKLAVQTVTKNYTRSEEDEVHGTTPSAPVYACPDPEVQFVSFCPNNNTLEIRITNEVAAAAQAAGLKTVTLLKSAATHDAWLNYMACPKLIGNFYDGDANTSEIVVYNGQITAREFAQSVNFNLHTTNIWLACEAYNDPMRTAVQKTSKSQKYAAGINNLAVGPSDEAAACAMKAAITGKPMTEAFQTCYAQLNRSSDEWGFDGAGADTFGAGLWTPPAPTSSTSTQ